MSALQRHKEITEYEPKKDVFTPQRLMYASMIKSKQLSNYILFDKIKYRNIENKVDKSGGFFHKSEMKQIAKDLGVNYNTFRGKVTAMCQDGWIQPYRTGYRLNSWKKIVAEHGYTEKKITIKEKTKKELVKRISEEYVKRHIKSQAVAKGNKKHLNKAALKKFAKSEVLKDDCSVSVRQVQKALGYKSASTGSRILKRLEADGKVKIEKRSKFLCELENLSFCLKNSDDDLRGRLFLYNNNVFERLRNNVIPLEPNDIVVQLLKKEKKVRDFNRMMA